MTKMKILWFTNSACGSVRRNSEEKVTSGGWLISLEEEMKKAEDIQLSVAFFSSTEKRSFRYDGVDYFPIYVPSASSVIMRIINRYAPLEKLDEKLLPAMLAVVKRVSPDLIHIHGTEERFGLIQDYVKDTPICFSIQGLMAPYERKFFSGMPYALASKHERIRDKIKRVSLKSNWQRYQFNARREEHFLKHSKYILGRTFWDKDITLALNQERKYFVVDEILRSPFYEKQWGKNNFGAGKMRLVSTMSSCIYKGFEMVLETADLLKRFSKVDFEWNIIGFDNSDKLVDIAQKITKLEYNSLNIKLLGIRNADYVSDVIAQSDIYVQVSHIENSPNSVCEAMIMGIPVIASFAGGTASLLENGKEGVLVQDGDPYVCAGAILDLYSNPSKAIAMGQAARARALERHNANRIRGQLLSAYQTVLEDYSD